jgi:hypothetical protein
MVSLIATDGSNCVTLSPNDDFVGTTELCVVHCDDMIAGYCDTTILIVTVLPPADTVLVTIPGDVPTEICLEDAIFQMPGTPTSSTFCNDEIVGEATASNLLGQCVTIDPVDGFTGTASDLFCVVHCYDDAMMICDTTYIGITVQSIGDKWITPSLKRDFRASNGDSMSLVFDTFNDGTNAFLFGINPYGVRREVQISGGGQDLRGFNTSWDVKWKGESKIYGDYYTSEMAIPLTSFKFKEGETKWRFQSYRFDLQTNERSGWYKVPLGQFLVNLAFMGDMHFEKPLGKSRTPLALIPYINTISEKDFTTDIANNNFKVGGDAKVSIGNGMNLDVTLNPDFSNVEVDNVITNLTRFEVGLPEKRQFFIDNSDLFGSLGGSRDANPFISRRIGIAKENAGKYIEKIILI